MSGTNGTFEKELGEAPGETAADQDALDAVDTLDGVVEEEEEEEDNDEDEEDEDDDEDEDGQNGMGGSNNPGVPIATYIWTEAFFVASHAPAPPGIKFTGGKLEKSMAHGSSRDADHGGNRNSLGSSGPVTILYTSVRFSGIHVGAVRHSRSPQCTPVRLLERIPAGFMNTDVGSSFDLGGSSFFFVTFVLFVTGCAISNTSVSTQASGLTPRPSIPHILGSQELKLHATPVSFATTMAECQVCVRAVISPL